MSEEVTAKVVAMNNRNRVVNAVNVVVGSGKKATCAKGGRVLRIGWFINSQFAFLRCFWANDIND